MPEIKTKDSESQSNSRINLKKKIQQKNKKSPGRRDSCRAQLATPESHERDDGRGYWSATENLGVIVTGKSTKGQEQCKCKPIPYEED